MRSTIRLRMRLIILLDETHFTGQGPSLHIPATKVRTNEPDEGIVPIWMVHAPCGRSEEGIAHGLWEGRVVAVDRGEARNARTGRQIGLGGS